MQKHIGKIILGAIILVFVGTVFLCMWIGGLGKVPITKYNSLQQRFENLETLYRSTEKNLKREKALHNALKITIIEFQKRLNAYDRAARNYYKKMGNLDSTEDKVFNEIENVFNKSEKRFQKIIRQEKLRALER